MPVVYKKVIGDDSKTVQFGGSLEMSPSLILEFQIATPFHIDCLYRLLYHQSWVLNMAPTQ